MKQPARQSRHDAIKVYVRPSYRAALEKAADFYEISVPNYLRMAGKMALRKDGFTITSEQRT